MSQPFTPPSYPAPPAPRQRHTLRWVLLGLTALAVLLFGGCSLLFVGAAAGSATQHPTPPAAAPAQPGAPAPAPAPAPAVSGTYGPGTYEITAQRGGQYTITPGTYETSTGYGYWLITTEANGQIGDPGYRMGAVNGHTLAVIKQADIGKYLQFGGNSEWTAKAGAPVAAPAAAHKTTVPAAPKAAPKPAVVMAQYKGIVTGDLVRTCTAKTGRTIARCNAEVREGVNLGQIIGPKVKPAAAPKLGPADYALAACRAQTGWSTAHCRADAAAGNAN